MLKNECRIIDGAKEVVEKLYGKYLMGIVTSSRKDHFDIIHEPLGLLKFFDFILTANDYNKFKPDPEPYLLAVEKSGFSNDECLAVEDSERGLISAKAAGIHCFVIPSELTSNGNFTAALLINFAINAVIFQSCRLHYQTDKKQCDIFQGTFNLLKFNSTLKFIFNMF